MTQRQRLAVGLVAAVALLLAGRGCALFYTDWAWYHALGSDLIWRAKVFTTTSIYASALVLGTVFAYLNLSSLKSSVIALVLPTRVGNIEIGEQVPASRLTIIVFGMSLCVAAVSALAMPSWTTVVKLLLDIRYNQTDPFLHTDLGFYLLWLPVESGLYTWVFVVFATVTLLVLALYSLTPSLRWENGRVMMTAHVRRHVAVLGTILIALIAWSFRLDMYNTVIRGNGPNGLFTRTDYLWLVPTDVFLSVAMLGVAVVVLGAIWTGHLSTSVVAVAVVIVLCVYAKILLPLASAYLAAHPYPLDQETPYQATQRSFTKLAIPADTAVPFSVRFPADSAGLANGTRTASSSSSRAQLPATVYPGARGAVVENDPLGIIRAPRVGGFMSRILNAWAAQSPRILNQSVSSTAAFVTRRDVRDRVRAIAPLFVQSSTIGARQTPLGLIWIVDLYSIGDHFPLSTTHLVGSQSYNYRSRVATALVSSTLGSVKIVISDMYDPIASLWFDKYPGEYFASITPDQLQKQLEPHPIAAVPTTAVDSTFRTRIAQIYLRMRAALDSGNLRSFGEAFDSLGFAVGVHR